MSFKTGDMIRFSGSYLTRRREDQTHKFVMQIMPREGIITEQTDQRLNVLSQGENVIILLKSAAIGPPPETKIEVISES